MDSREIMEGHKIIFRVTVAPGAHTEADSREIAQVLEAEVDLIKAQMLADLGLLVKLFQGMQPDAIIARNQATSRDSVTDVKKMNVG